MRRYNSLSTHTTNTKTINRNSTASKQILQKPPSGLSELSGSVVNKKTASQSPKSSIAAIIGGFAGH
jgi:hypothetical protein